MGDEPLGDVTHAERRELDALRRRAYAPDADIVGDPRALSRLRELEDRVRLVRLGLAPDPLTGIGAAGEVQPAPAAPGGDAVAIAGTPASVRTPRWHMALIAGTAAAAVLLGAVAWGRAQSDAEAGSAQAAAAVNQQAEADYEQYLDGLRDDVLSLPGSEAIANRMVRDELQPYGILYGRIVGVGPTFDSQFCMIIANLPTSSIICIPAESERAEPATVTLPSWYSDSESDLFTGLGDLVSYTLMPGGSVVAVPVSPDAAAARNVTGSVEDEPIG